MEGKERKGTFAGVEMFCLLTVVSVTGLSTVVRTSNYILLNRALNCACAACKSQVGVLQKPVPAVLPGLRAPHTVAGLWWLPPDSCSLHSTLPFLDLAQSNLRFLELG